MSSPNKPGVNSLLLFFGAEREPGFVAYRRPRRVCSNGAALAGCPEQTRMISESSTVSRGGSPVRREGTIVPGMGHPTRTVVTGAGLGKAWSTTLRRSRPRSLVRIPWLYRDLGECRF